MGIQIDLDLRDNIESSRATVSGFELQPFTKAAARKFGIPVSEYGYHPQLWSVCNRIFGRVPDWWHTRDVKGEWDLYEAWRNSDGKDYEVKVEKRAVAARIVSVESKPAAQVTRSRRNPSSHRASFTVELSDTISTEHSRSVSDEWAVGMETKIGVEIGGELAQAKTTVETTLSFGYTRGQETTHARGDSVSVSDSITVELDPGEEAVAAMSCNRGKIMVDVDYECRLVGTAMFSFAQRYLRGQRDYGVDIGKVLRMLHGNEPCHRVTERMGLGFVSDGVATLRDSPSSG